MTKYLRPGAAIPPCVTYYDDVAIVTFTPNGPGDITTHSEKDERVGFDGHVLTITRGSGMSQTTEMYPAGLVFRIVTQHEPKVATHVWESTIVDEADYHDELADYRNIDGATFAMYCETCDTMRPETGAEYNAWLDSEIAAGRAVPDAFYEPAS